MTTTGFNTTSVMMHLAADKHTCRGGTRGTAHRVQQATPRAHTLHTGCHLERCLVHRSDHPMRTIHFTDTSGAMQRHRRTFCNSTIRGRKWKTQSQTLRQQLPWWSFGWHGASSCTCFLAHAVQTICSTRSTHCRCPALQCYRWTSALTRNSGI